MLVVLDTNHFRELREDTAAGKNLQRRIEERAADVFTCIVAVEETVQGWFAVPPPFAADGGSDTAVTRMVMLPAWIFRTVGGLRKDSFPLGKLSLPPRSEKFRESLPTQPRCQLPVARPQVGV
jgi:hypothetical protein